jgi:CRP-like cAMP-binding protein
MNPVEKPDVRTAPFGSKMRALPRLSAKAIAALRSLPSVPTTFEAGARFIAAGDLVRKVYLITAGWALRSRTLADGRRQILNYHLPGDLIAIDAGLFETTIRDWSAVTRVEALAFEADTFFECAGRDPALLTGILWYAAQELSQIGEHLIGVGRRSAAERTAHLLLELWFRLRRCGMADAAGYALPLTLEDLADTLGLTPVHVSRTLRTLRERKLIDVHGHRPRRVDILNPVAAAMACGFDPGDMRLDSRGPTRPPRDPG